MVKAFIYGLVSSSDPNIIKYIGVTTNLSARLNGHKAVLKSESKFLSNPHKGRWIRNIYAEGNVLEICKLEEFNDASEAYSKEQEYIDSYSNLTNIAPGGKGGCHMTSEELKKAMAKAQLEQDYLGKAAKARQTPEWREAARQRGRKQFESPEARAELSRRSKEMWAKRSPEERIPWNKGLRTTGKDYNITGFKAGSEELKQHSAEKSREYYAKLKEDPELYKKHMDARSEVPEKVSKKNKANWDALSEEERKLRGLKMSLGKKYSKAKKNNWVLDLSPKPCPRCGEQQ